MFLAMEATVVEAVATNLRVAFPPADCLIRICLRPPLRTKLVVLVVETNLREPCAFDLGVLCVLGVGLVVDAELCGMLVLLGGVW